MTLFEGLDLVLKDVTERLARLDIPYMLTGSMAMTRYAMMRMTTEMDIVLAMNDSDGQRVINAFEPDYYVPHGRVHGAIAADRCSTSSIKDRSLRLIVSC